MEQKKQKRKAFTLIELLVVIIIIGPKMAIIESALERFGLDCGQYPDDSMGLDALLTAPSGLEEKWNGPYLKPSQLLDPWDHPYIYVSEGEINPGSYDLVSLGADGVEGGEGDNKDIFNE